MGPQTDLLEIIGYIDPAELDYQDWLSVGMALKHEGYTAADWDDWSRRDRRRYHPGECFKKWYGFHGAAEPVTAGTIVQMAKEKGWRPQGNDGHEIDWNDTIGGKEDHVVIDRGWLEGCDIEEPKEWDAAGDLIRYLETLFEAGENVGYVTESWEKTDEKGIRWLPKKGDWSRTAGQLIEELEKHKDDIGAVLGDYQEAAGAWIRFNPLDGNGCKNANVTDFRYALVESDNMPIDKQNAIIRELELPVACLVYSGKKSIHAIVKIEAANYEEYRKRVDYLYKVCQKNGMIVDTQNKNPSRLSRMPGVTRNGKKQFLIDTNIGRSSWNEWFEWIEGVNDDLPEPEGMADVWNNLPDLSPCLIKNVLRQGHKMLIAGPSKAGKSFLQIELCIAIAEGRKWIGWDCTQGRVLYVNLELDRASCLHRFKDVYDALEWEPKNLRNIDIWNLRGKSVPMDKLAPKLIRRAAKKNYIAVIIDPIYKVITGDENSADQMANFCNQFDKVCTELGCAVIYCHHHSKGSQGAKKSIDRASGSGVFARDPDALLDIIELETTEELMKQEENKAICDVCLDWLKKYDNGLEKGLSQDDRCSSMAVYEYCRKNLRSLDFKVLNLRIEAVANQVKMKTAWRIDATLREFQKPQPVNLWFDYPIHRKDSSGALKDIQPDNEKPPWQKGAEKRRKSAQDKRNKINSDLEIAYASLSLNGEVTIKDLAEYWDGLSEKTVKDRINKSRDFYYKSGIVYQKESSQGGNDL